MLIVVFTRVRHGPYPDRNELCAYYSFYFYSYVLILYSRARPDVSRKGSSVSIVSGYGLDDLEIEVKSPAEAKKLFL
jgi:hypothetical protein